MPGKALVNMDSFAGKARKAGDILSDEDISMLTATTRDALVAGKMISIEGFTAPGSPESFSDLELKIDALRAELADAEVRNRERHEVVIESLKAISASLGLKAPKKAKAPGKKADATANK